MKKISLLTLFLSSHLTIYSDFENITKPVMSNEANIKEILLYAAGAGGGFGGTFPAGYHTVLIGGEKLKGERDPIERLSKVPYDFKNKCVLDLGTNIGGMLFAVADKIKYGIGVDFNARAINAANKLKTYYKLNNVDFFVFDLEKEPIELIKKLISVEKIDICFMLSMCAWVRNWKSIINFAADISSNLLFEAHGPMSAQKVQVDFLQQHYKKVTLINPTSEDDPINKNRSLYLCSN